MPCFSFAIPCNQPRAICHPSFAPRKPRGYFVMLLLSKAIRLAAVLSLVGLLSSLHAQTFGIKQRIFTGPSPYGIKAVDINKDGNQDLIWFSSSHNVEIRLGEGDGLFALSGPI